MAFSIWDPLSRPRVGYLGSVIVSNTAVNMMHTGSHVLNHLERGCVILDV